MSDCSSDVCSSDLSPRSRKRLALPCPYRPIWGEGEVCLMIQIRNSPALDAFWMPFTANRQFKRAPRLLASASGMYYRSADGREIMDGTAGLWCVNAGRSEEHTYELPSLMRISLAVFCFTTKN